MQCDSKAVCWYAACQQMLKMAGVTPSEFLIGAVSLHINKRNSIVGFMLNHILYRLLHSCIVTTYTYRKLVNKII